MATNWSGFVRNFHDFFKQQQQQDQPEPLIKSYFKRGLNNVKLGYNPLTVKMNNITNKLKKTDSNLSINLQNTNNNSNLNNGNNNNNKNLILTIQKSTNDLQQTNSQQSPQQQTPTMKYLPTYRLESKKPVNKETVEKMMEKVITKSFEDFQYESKAAQKLAKSVSEELKYKFKTFEFDRFRVISIVTIGEKFYQGMESMCSFLWDPNADGFVNFTYETPQYFVIATLYYIYYD